MPSSRPELIPFVVNLVMELQPRSILEIGTGFGKYGFLFREYLDIWGAATEPARLHRAGWRVRIDGIECYAPYISDLQRQIYDRIIIGDARVEIDRLETYDLIFLGDVIEHFPKNAGRQLLDKCVAHAERAVIVTTPNYFHAQGPEYGNERETHHCLWTAEDFAVHPGAQCHVVAGRYNLAVIPAGAVTMASSAAPCG
ncbi:MAG: class I SAM-dependent methyltransferase [Candidatus Zixiibacteriota bacterium]